MPRHQLFLMLLFWPAVSCADELARIDLALPNVRWQQLPRDVLGVCIGPDGRTWHQLSPYISGWSLNQAKSRVAREWKEAAPQITGAKLVFLEPGGRAWFTFGEMSRSLHGYDGNTWLDLSPEKETFLSLGISRSPGRMLTNRSPRLAGGRAWFVGHRGVYNYSGKEWDQQHFEEKVALGTLTPTFAVSPGGKFAAAVYGRGPTLWTWLEGKWTKGPDSKDGSAFGLDEFCVTDQGILWFRYGGGLRSRRLPGALGKEPAELATVQLIQQLGDDDFTRREAASTRLAEMGPGIMPELEAAMSEATDAEIKLRLKKLLNQLSDSKAARPAVVAKIGEYFVSEVKQFSQDEQGTIYIAAAKIRREGGKPVPGLLRVAADGQAALCENPGGLETWWGHDGGLQRDFWLASEQGLWLTPQPGFTPTGFLDWKEKRVTAELPELQPSHVVARDSAGRIFASAEFGPSVVVAFTPEAPEDRLSLEVTRVPIVRGSIHYTAIDGSIWVQRKVEGLSRFNGAEWRIADPGEADTLVPVTSGEEGVVLYQGVRKVYGGKGNHYLFQRDSLVAKGDLHDIVRRHRDLLAKAFSTPRTSLYSPVQSGGYGSDRYVSLCADKAGNLWILEASNQVSVLVGEEWLDATGPLEKAGMRNGHASFMSLFGDGSRVYLSALPGRMYGPDVYCQVGEVREGKLFFEDSSAVMVGESGIPMGLREPTGQLWVAGDRFQGANEQLTLRIGQNAQAQVLEESGWPLLVDEGGNVWLGRLLNQPQNKLNIWRGGKIEQRLEVPGTDNIYSLFSRKAGSVYVRTPMGLIHLAADETGQYRARKTYRLPISPNFPHPGFSSLGYLVTTTYHGSPPEPHATLVRLPEE